MSSPEKEKLNPKWTSDSFNVVRPVYIQEELNIQADYHTPTKTLSQHFLSVLRLCGVSSCVRNLLPIASWLPQYSIKNDLFGDVVAGCTVAVMHIPQGMAYAMLGGVPPVVGLYMAFFPVLAYFFFGTSRHVSMGTFAVACLMTGKTVQTYADVDAHENLAHNSTALGTGPDSLEGLHFTPIEVATAVCLMVGIYQVLMWVFRLGVLSTLLSEALVSGFIVGATVHVMTSQLKEVFGISVPRYKGNFKIILTLIAICKNLPNINWAAFIIALICIIIMSLNNELLKPWIAKRSRIPVPIELIAVVTGTLINKYCDIHKMYGVKLVGAIPTGIPTPTVPRMELIHLVALDSFTICMVTYTITMSLALMFATKNKYEVEPNQELLAMGAGNIVGSFFLCVPFCASLSRSSIQWQTGGKTQIASVVSCGLLLCVLLWVGPFFEDLPRAVLAAIILVSLKGMMMGIKEIVRFWNLSKIDAAVWIITCSVVIIVNIDYGLLIGIISSVATLFIRAQKPYTCLLGNVPNTDIYLDIKRYKAAMEINGLRIFHYCGGLNFASKNTFKETLYRKVGLTETHTRSSLGSGLLKKSASKDSTSFDYSQSDTKLQFVIVDATAMCYVDAGGVTMLRSVYRDFEKKGISMLLSGANGPILEMLEVFDRLESGQNKLHFTIFPSVHDAVLYALSQMQATGAPPAITTT